MKNINTQKEWNFITYDIIHNRPEKIPYIGKDLLKRELLFLLTMLLNRYQDETNSKRKSFINIVYFKSKTQYLNLAEDIQKTKY